MSTPSMLLLCAGAAASLASVWTLAGLSESSTLRSTPRVVAATVVGLLVEAVVYGAAPAAIRGELALPLLFSTTSVLALAVGAAKIDAALSDKDGPRVVRRAAGIVSGTFFGMAAVGAASLDLSTSSVGHARLGWALMFALVTAAVVVFAQRARYAGVGFLALGQRAFVLALVGVALLAGARLTVAATPTRAALPSSSPAAVPPPSVVESAPPAEAPTASSAPSPSASSSAAAAAPSASATAAPSASASAAPDPTGAPGELQIEAVSTRGMLEADARGGVARRMERVQACLSDPKNRQSGVLSLKIGIDPSGSVAYSRATGGDLVGTPLAACILPVFYKMGFAAPASNRASFEITLRSPPQ